MHDWSASTAAADPRPSDAGFGLATAAAGGFATFEIVDAPCTGGRWYDEAPATAPTPSIAPASAWRPPALPPLRPRQAPPPPRRAERTALAAAAAALALGAPSLAAAAGSCSPYMGQVLINEVRVGNSNSIEAINQVELYNSGGVASAVWQSWRIEVWQKDGSKAASLEGNYALSAGHTSSGPFIWNNSTMYWLKNKDKNAADIALLDANGDFVAYFGIEGKATTTALPGCLGTPTYVQSSGGKDEDGSIRRSTDGGAWPASVTKTSAHTIGRTNACTTDRDLSVTMEVDWLKPVVNATTVSYQVTVFNASCSDKSESIVLRTTNISTTNFASIVRTASQGSTALSGSNLDWTIGTLNASAEATLTITGIPKNLGALTTTSSITSTKDPLVNTGDDSEGVTITVYNYNYAGLDAATDELTEGTDTDKEVQVLLNVPATHDTTVNWSRGGTAGAGDTSLGASGSVVIPAGETSAPLAFTITDDSVHEATETLMLTLTSATSSDTKVRLGTAPTGDILVQTMTLYDDDDALSVHHYELSLAATSLACLASSVTVTACADASSPCTSPATSIAGQTATLSTSAGTLGTTSVSFDGSGVATTTLSHAAAANGANVSVTLSGETTPGASARQCCQDGSCSSANSCTTTFATAGFIIAAVGGGGTEATIPAQTAGSSSAGYLLRAVQTNTTTKACEAAITGTTNVDWSYTCNDPTTCAAGNRLSLTGNSAVAVAGNPNSGGSSSTAVPMTFNVNGRAPFSFDYADVGRITLRASRAAGGALLTPLSGSSNAFVVKPAGFVLSGIRCSSYAAGSCATTVLANPGNNPGASDASGSAFVPAGTAFSATVTAVDALGNATPNYGRETSAEGVRLTASLVAPAGGNAPALGNPTGFGSFVAGAATGTGFTWSEAGVITLAPSVADADYLGSGNVAGSASGPVGRFYAHHLTTAVTPACSASFTYAGQPFSAAIAARNAGGTVLQNYGSASFAKAVTLSDGAGFGVGSLSGGAVAAAAFGSGSAGATPTFAFTDKLTAPGTLVLRATDSDGASSSGQTEGSSVLRSGRLRVANGFGRENAALQLAVQAEYWSGASWLLNGQDSCTTVPAAAVALGNYRSAQGAATAAWTTAASSVGLAAGSGVLTLAAPSPAGTGTVELALNLGSTTAQQSCTAGLPATSAAGMPWLRSRFGACSAVFDRDPAARATFGIFAPETRRTVHAREIF